MEYRGFCGDSFVSQSILANACRTVNLYPEVIGGVGRKVDVALYPTPGLSTYATSAEKPNRGIFAQDGLCFAIIGTKLNQVTELTPTTGTLTNRGTVATNTQPAYMTTNGDLANQLAATCGGQLYILNLTALGGGLANPVGLADFVVYLDGRFCVLDASQSILKISNHGDGLTGYSTLVSQRDTASDPWKAMALSGGKEIWLMGEQTGDVFYDTGAFPFPFGPRDGILIKPGIGAPHTLRELNGRMYWLSHSEIGAGQIYRADGYSPQPISTEALNHAIAGYQRASRIDDAEAWTYEQDGHGFYVINFPTAGATWAYDDKTGWWHERGKYDGMSGLYGTWGPQYHAHEFKHNLVGDYRSGTIYRMGLDLYEDTNSEALRRLRIAPAIFKERKALYFDRLELYLETAVAIGQTGQGSDPQCFLRSSDDGGRSWGSERWRSSGKIGQTSMELVWHQLGRAKDRVFSFAMSDPVPWRILSAFLEVR